MDEANELINAALEEAVSFPSDPTFRAWCQAYRAGRSDTETVKRAFRSVWSGLADGRFDDFMRLLANAEARMTTLGRERVVGWAQAAIARAVLELMHARRLASQDAAARRAKAADIAAAALRFAQMAKIRPSRVLPPQ
jgi:hypothetical protein